MEAIKKFFKQQSTFRGTVIMAATIAGVDGEVVTALTNVADHIPELGLAILGAAEIFRQEKESEVK